MFVVSVFSIFHKQFIQWKAEIFKLSFGYLILMGGNWVPDKMEGLAYVDMWLGASWAFEIS